MHTHFPPPAQQQALQTSVNQLANQQMNQLGIMGLAPPLPPQAIFQHQSMAQNLALNQNLMGQNIGQNLGKKYIIIIIHDFVDPCWIRMSLYKVQAQTTEAELLPDNLKIGSHLCPFTD